MHDTFPLLAKTHFPVIYRDRTDTSQTKPRAWSSIEPDDGGSEVNSGEEAASGFVMAGGDSPVLLVFGEKVLDQTSSSIKFPVIRARRLPVLFRWDDHRLSDLERGRDYSLVGIMPVVGENGFRLKVGKKRV